MTEREVDGFSATILGGVIPTIQCTPEQLANPHIPKGLMAACETGLCATVCWRVESDDPNVEVRLFQHGPNPEALKRIELPPCWVMPDMAEVDRQLADIREWAHEVHRYEMDGLLAMGPH